jgi:hypothetical protein
MYICTIKKKQELLFYQKDIETLSRECFGDKVSLDLWHWAYIDNPNGEPLVSLCYEDERLVGHYAVIPMPVSENDSQLNSYLSMTTMVASDYRKYGLFTKLAEANYKEAFEEKVDFIFGFPNAMSTPGFRKRLKWNLPPADYIASVSKTELLNSSVASTLIWENRFRLNLRDERIRKWRLSKPNAEYVFKEGLVYKNFGGGIDLIYFDSLDALEGLPNDQPLNILLSSNVVDFLENKVMDYQFGGISITREFQPELFSRQMCMSDVF